MSNADLRARVSGALLGLACGDALGAPVEFKDRDYVRREYGTLRDMVGGGGFGWAPGEWTDDTGMTLAVAEGILDSPHDPVPVVGERFLDWSRTAKDIGSTIRAALSNYAGNWAAAAATTPQARTGKAAGNGSLMRTVPVALAYANAEQLALQSARVSGMTHWDAQAEVCCLTYCLWVRSLLLDSASSRADGERRAALWQDALLLARSIAARQRLADDTHGPDPLPDDFWPRLQASPSVPQESWQPTGYAGYVVDTLEAAVAAVVQAESLEDALVRVVNTAGEADTIAAVAGGAAGAWWGVEDIPRRWLTVLHGRERLERAAEGLTALRNRLR